MKTTEIMAKEDSLNADVKSHKFKLASQTPTPVFVGQYRRVVDTQGRVRFPADWLSMLDDGCEFFVLPNPNKTKSLLLVLAKDYRKARTPPPATPIKVLADGRIRITKELLDYAGIKAQVLFMGALRTIKLTSPRH